MEGFSERIRNLLWLTFGQTKFMFTLIFYQNKMKVFRDIAAKTSVLWNILELTFGVTFRFMISCSQFLGCMLLFCVFVIEKLTALQDQKMIMNFFFDHFFLTFSIYFLCLVSSSERIYNALEKKRHDDGMLNLSFSISTIASLNSRIPYLLETQRTWYIDKTILWRRDRFCCLCVTSNFLCVSSWYISF